MPFFQDIDAAPDDPILSLTVLYAKDERSPKVNLGIGAYMTAEGSPHVLPAVRKAEARILDQNLDKAYLQIDGHTEFRQTMLKLVYGKHCSALAARRIASAQTVGGSGALRVAGEFIRKFISPRIYLSNPSWANHKPCFRAAGLEVQHYPYYDEENKTINFAGMIDTLKQAPEGSAVLLQACCHNPTGLDLSDEQWQELSKLIKERKLLPVFDSAYQGFGDDLKKDAYSIRLFTEEGHDLITCSSCSKNFGLYGERVGLLSVVCRDKEEAERTLSQIKALIRANYSNPPLQGARIVADILTSPELRTEWVEELSLMRLRIQEMRKGLVSQLMAKGDVVDFTFMRNQRGMFSFSGLTAEQVIRLREEFAIYMPKSGRINVAGLTNQNMDHVVQSIVEVTKVHETGTV